MVFLSRVSRRDLSASLQVAGTSMPQSRSAAPDQESDQGGHELGCQNADSLVGSRFRNTDCDFSHEHLKKCVCTCMCVCLCTCVRPACVCACP